MNFFELVQKRYSVRQYKTQPVEKEKLEKILETVRHAPSAVNNQPWHFVVIQDPQMLEKICTAYRRDWLKTAPAIIVACGDHSQAWRRMDGKDHCDIDIAIAIDHLTLAAAEVGLGTCWICLFNAMDVSLILSLPKNIEPIALIPIGYPDDTPTDRHSSRKPLEEIVHWEQF